MLPASKSGIISSKAIGFLGAGSLASALIGGLVRSGTVPPERIIVTNKSDDSKLSDLQKKFGVTAVRDKSFLMSNSDVLVICVKPYDVAGLLAEIRGMLKAGHIIISAAAGISSKFIKANLIEHGESSGAGVVSASVPVNLTRSSPCRDVPVIRAMPNTPCQIGRGITAIAPGEGAGEAELEIARELFGASGAVVTVTEPELDAVTAVSGSGPAYVYYLAESMMAAARSLGLQHEVGRELVLQTILGAAHMMVETGEEPELLRKKVTSPGGTTMAAISVFESRNLRETVVEALKAAAARAAELGR